jgi:hypothetical protein
MFYYILIKVNEILVKNYIIPYYKIMKKFENLNKTKTEDKKDKVDLFS